MKVTRSDVVALLDGSLLEERARVVRAELENDEKLASFFCTRQLMREYEQYAENAIEPYVPSSGKVEKAHSRDGGADRRSWVKALVLAASLLAMTVIGFKVSEWRETARRTASEETQRKAQQKLQEFNVSFRGDVLNGRALNAEGKYAETLAIAANLESRLKMLDNPSMEVQYTVFVLSSMAKTGLERLSEIEQDCKKFESVNEAWLMKHQNRFAEVLRFKSLSQSGQGKVSEALATANKARNLKFLDRSVRKELEQDSLSLLTMLEDNLEAERLINQSRDLQDLFITVDQWLQNSRGGIPSEEFSQEVYGTLSKGNKSKNRFSRAAVNLALAKMGRKELTEAAAALASIEALPAEGDSDRFAILVTRGALALAENNIGEALSSLDSAFKDVLPNVFWQNESFGRYHYALACEKAEQFSKADTQYQIALEICEANAPQSAMAKFMKLEQAEFLVVHGTGKEIADSKRLLESNKKTHIQLVQTIRKRWIVRADL